MKQKDILLIAVISIVAGVLSFFVANLLFGGAKASKLTYPIVDPIKSDFSPPNTAYFNKDSLNPTKDITIGDTTNNKPFNQ